MMNPSSNKRLRIISQHLLESGSSIMGQPTSTSMKRVIVIGGGLAGLSAAHTVLERGGRVLLLDKNPFMGGNSTKATSGINGAPTRAQAIDKIQDSVLAFEEDTALSATKGASKEIHPLGKVLVGDSGPAVEWLISRFGLDLSIISRLGGHSYPRTHRGKEKFPGMTITYALMEKLEKLAKETPNDVEIILKARATKLIYNGGEVVGVEYVHDGQTHSEYGPVVIATGGFAADFAPDGLLAKTHPEWLHLPTTNGEHCTGDGIKMVQAINGATIDLKAVQVHPTGLVHPDDPDAKVKWLAAEALRGVGGLVLDREGNRFCDELGRRDYVTGKMWEHNKGPYYLVLNSKASKSIEWHCKHYQGRGLMKFYNNANEFAKDAKIPVENLKQTFQKFNGYAQKPGSDPFGLKFYDAAPFSVDDTYYVAIITPVLHYTMGGVKIDTNGAVLNEDGSAPIPGVFAGGEVAGGIHGLNRLGGSSLLDCVVFGRVAGASAAKHLLQRSLNSESSAQSAGGVPQSVTIQVRPEEKRVSLEFQWDQGTSQARTSQAVSVPKQSSIESKTQKADTAAVSQEQTKPATVDKNREITLEEIAKHNKNDDCWVAINGQVLDATGFLDDHPGGRKAIMLYAGKDASEEFNMLHEANVIEKYAPQTVIGKLKK